MRDEETLFKCFRGKQRKKKNTNKDSEIFLKRKAEKERKHKYTQ